MNSVQFGVKNGKFVPCDGRYNCAITQKVDGQKPNVQPIVFTGENSYTN